MFGQTFDFVDLGTIGVLILLECVLSIDNAVVLGLLTRRVSENLRGRVLSYGLAGSLAFRVVAAALAVYLLQWRIVQLLGGIYLLYIGIKHFARRKSARGDASLSNTPPAGFWRTVIAIELADAAFAVDSILAAIALVGPAPASSHWPHPKLWVVIVGGMIGVIAMRFAAAGLGRLLNRFPRFELSGYLIVLLVGVKLVAVWATAVFGAGAFDSEDWRRPEFWGFWMLMLGCAAVGFVGDRPKIHPPVVAHDSSV